MNIKERIKRREKKNRDKFTITIIGVVIYSVVLIMVMVGSYIGVKVILKNYDNKVQAAMAKQEKSVAENAEEKPTATPTPKATPEPVEETVPDEHEVEITEIFDAEKEIVDYSKELYKPGKRDKSLKWKDSVFSKIEDINNPSQAPVNSFVYKRLTVPLAENHSADYKIYTNPETSSIEKITEIMNCGDNLEVLDYYFDLGNINYVARYRTFVDKPVSISSADIESRYYFSKDCLVRYIYCSEGKATEYSLADLDTYSQGTVDQYDFLESEMINRAYIVYNVSKNIKESEQLYGYVMDEYQTPLEEAEIIVKRESDGTVVSRTTTDGDGFYKLTVECRSDETYSVTANKDTLNGLTVYNIPARFGSGKYAVDPMYLSYAGNGAVYNVQIVVRDAIDSNKALSGANISLRRGINDINGEIIASGALDDTGCAIVPMYAGCYTAEVSKGGYETLYFTVNVRVDHQTAVGFMMPDVAENTVKAVLSWEKTPLDLDIKAISSNGANVIKSTTDSIGATTAEVVSIDNAGTDNYRFYVTDYTSIVAGDALSYNMTMSNAVVDIYTAEGQVARLHVPVANCGVIWEAAEVHNLKVLPVNSYFYAVENSPIWTAK